MTKPMTEPVLERLLCEALVSYLGQAPDFEALIRPGCSYGLSNEPIADLNYLVAGKGAQADDRFGKAVSHLLERELPFLGILFPHAVAEVAGQAADLGLAHAVDFPIMVREDESLEPAGAEDVVVMRSSGVQASIESASALSSSFQLPEVSVQRVLPAALYDSPGVDLFLAMQKERCVGTVTITYHGDTAGIWSMGTTVDVQKRGIGRRLLSTVLSELRKQGIRCFFLGATPAGYSLYESLGFLTRITTQVWVSGETHQA